MIAQALLRFFLADFTKITVICENLFASFSNYQQVQKVNVYSKLIFDKGPRQIKQKMLFSNENKIRTL